MPRIMQYYEHFAAIGWILLQLDGMAFDCILTQAYLFLLLSFKDGCN